MATTKKKKAAPKKAAAKKSAPKKTTTKTARKKTVKKKAAKKSVAKKTNTQKIKVTREQHHRMICEAAYYISLERTSETVNPDEDWLQAEAAINKICIITN